MLVAYKPSTSYARDAMFVKFLVQHSVLGPALDQVARSVMSLMERLLKIARKKKKHYSVCLPALVVGRRAMPLSDATPYQSLLTRQASVVPMSPSSTEAAFLQFHVDRFDSVFKPLHTGGHDLMCCSLNCPSLCIFRSCRLGHAPARRQAHHRRPPAPSRETPYSNQ